MAPRYPGGPTPPPPVDKGRIWIVACVTGVVAYGALLAVHLSTEDSGSASFRAGEMIPIAGVSAVLVALLAQAVSTRRTAPWWIVSLSVLMVSALWYSGVHIAPRLADDARAEVSGQADYVLSAPERAGEWERLRGEGAIQREAEMRSRIAQAPESQTEGLDDVVYAEYRSGFSRLGFLGINTSGEFKDDLRESSRQALRNFMAGAGVTSPEQVDEGDLGGTMACSGDAPGLPAGVIFCAWADASTLGQVTIVQVNLDIDDAAAITRDFRDHVTTEE